MLKNYIVISYRNLRKHAGHSIIGLIGLTLGITSCLLIFVFVKHELHFDNYHENAERIYRVNYILNEPEGIQYYNVTPNALADALRKEVLGAELVTRIQLSYRDEVVQAGDQSFTQEGVVYVDPQFFDLFDYEFLSGNMAKSMSEPKKVVLTKSIALRYFGEESALGQIIRLGDKSELEVAGVVAAPSNSHLPFQFFVSLLTFSNTFDNWKFSDGNVTYLLLKGPDLLEQVKQSLNLVRRRYQEATYAAKASFTLQPVRSIHTQTQYGAYRGSYNIDDTYLWGLTFIGFLIIISASVNYINLSIAQATLRGREIGVRKVLGSTRSQLIAQLMSETFFLTLLSVIVSVPLAYWLLPKLSLMFHLRLSLDLLVSSPLFFFLAVVVVVVSFLAGLYPAFLLSGYQPVAALKGITGTSTFGALNMRKGLMIFQIIVSQVLLISVIVIYNQMQFIKNEKLGFDTKARIILRVPDNQVKREVFRSKMVQFSGIESVTYAMGGPTKGGTLNSKIDHLTFGDHEIHTTVTIPIDRYYLDVFDIPVIAGQGLLSEHEILPVSHVALINESMVAKLAYTNPQEAIGAALTINDFKVKVIGVVKDFHQKSFRNKIQPAVLFYWPRWTHHAGIKITSRNLPVTLRLVEDVYKEVFPDTYFSYYFLDDYVQSLYKAEERIYNVFKVFTLVALMIGCLGLYSMVSISTVRRTKEIGIRKVLGASAAKLVIMLTTEFTWLFVIGFLIAVPLAYFTMQQWLENFAYRTNIGFVVIILTGFAGILISWLVIGYQSIKAARTDPVESLKNE